MQEQPPIARRRGQSCRLLNILVAGLARATRAAFDNFDSSGRLCTTLLTEWNM